MPATKAATSLYKEVLRLMGNRFEITVASGNEAWARGRIAAAIREIQRIEAMLTTFRDDSETAAVNAMAGIAPVKVSQEFFQLVERSIKISGLTQGAFDITYGGIDKSLWNFDTGMTSLPDPAVARQSVRLINYKNVLLDATHGTVMLKEKGMRIGFGGIGKGYAADKARQLLQSQGVESGIVNAAGDLTCWGAQPDGSPWTIGIADPDQARQPFSALRISNMSIATSGNYEKYATINGKRYAHTIDPATGLPVTGVKSVTILCPSAELADAMATPVMVMGAKVGLHLVNQLRNIACIIIDDQNHLSHTNNIHVTQ